MMKSSASLLAICESLKSLVVPSYPDTKIEPKKSSPPNSPSPTKKSVFPPNLRHRNNQETSPEEYDEIDLNK